MLLLIDREEVLTEITMFWNKAKALNLAEALVKKFNRVGSLLSLVFKFKKFLALNAFDNIKT